jgi:hypothetical protein
MPYFFIPFELEAINNETNWKYPTNGAVYQWKEFKKKLSLKEKYNFAKDYKKNYKDIGFKLFVREVIYPLIMRTS